jgi:hypothetical protein
MLGWMILFAVMVILGTILILAGDPAEVSAGMVSSIFGLLFLLGLLTRAVRGRAW